MNRLCVVNAILGDILQLLGRGDAQIKILPVRLPTSVNEHATLDGVAYFFSFGFTKLLSSDTVQGTLIIFVLWGTCAIYSGYNFFLEGNYKFDEEKFTFKKRLFLECENGPGK